MSTGILTPVSITSGSSYSIADAQRNIVRTSTGFIYVLFRDTTANKIQMWKSIDNGATWSHLDSLNEPSGADLRCACMHILSTNAIETFYWNRNSGSIGFGLNEVPFSTATDTWGTATTISIPLLAATADSKIASACDSNDKSHVVYLDDNQNRAGTFKLVVYLNNVSGSWSPVVFPDLANVQFGSPDICVDQDNIPKISYLRNTAGTETIAAAFGNANNATAFTANTAVSTLTGSNVSTRTSIISMPYNGSSIKQDGVLWMDISGSVQVGWAFHNAGDSWATWTTQKVNNHFMTDGSLSSDVRKEVHFLASDSSFFINGIVTYQMNTGDAWNAAYTLETPSISTGYICAKYAFYNDNYGETILDVIYTGQDLLGDNVYYTAVNLHGDYLT